MIIEFHTKSNAGLFDPMNCVSHDGGARHLTYKFPVHPSTVQAVDRAMFPLCDHRAQLPCPEEGADYV